MPTPIEMMIDKACGYYMAEVACVNQITCGARTNVFLNEESAARTMCVEQWNRRYTDRTHLLRASNRH
jgi:hypothetical protein